MTAKNQAAGGFTLVEVLVALTLLAVVAAMIGSTSRLMSSVLEGLGLHRAVLADELLVRGALRDRLEGALYLNVGEPGRYIAAIEGDEAHMALTVLRPDYEQGQALGLVELTIEPHGSGFALLLEIGDLAPDEVSLETGPAPNERLLMQLDQRPTLAFLRVPDDAGEAPVWEAEWKDEARLPAAMRLTFVESASPPVIVPFRLTLPSLCGATTETPAEGCETL